MPAPRGLPPPAGASAAAPTADADVPDSYTLTFSDISAERVPRADMDSETDPYVRFVLLGQDGYLPTACRTSVLVDCADPAWPDTLTLMLPGKWKGSDVKIVLWDQDTMQDDEAVGTATIRLALKQEPVKKSVIMKGQEQGGNGGYTFPPFKLNFTYVVTPNLSPATAATRALARCLLSATSCLSCIGHSEREEAAARVLQLHTGGFFAKKKQAAQKDKAASVIERRAKKYLEGKHESEMEAAAFAAAAAAAKKKSPFGSLLGVVKASGGGGDLQRAKTRPPAHAEKDRPGRQRGGGTDAQVKEVQL